MGVRHGEQQWTQMLSITRAEHVVEWRATTKPDWISAMSARIFTQPALGANAVLSSPALLITFQRRSVSASVIACERERQKMSFVHARARVRSCWWQAQIR
eukprot:5459380-Prymnesium_polylepis.2